MSNSGSSLSLSSVLTGLCVLGGALMTAKLAKQYADSVLEKEIILKNITKLIEKESNNITKNGSQNEIEQEGGLEQQIFKIKSKTKDGAPANILDSEFSAAKQIEANKLIYRICITGGPCAGKTSGLVFIAEKLFQDGFEVYVVPETATMIVNAGGMIEMSQYNEAQQISFQKNLMRTQAQLEDSFVGISKLKNKKSIILCDRGLMDGSAYIEPSSWNKMLKEMGITEVHIRDKRYLEDTWYIFCQYFVFSQRYDCVIHLVTAADGAESFYNMDNYARYESPQEAITVDRKLQLAWLGHPNYHIVDNNSVKSFEDKLQKMVNSVRQAVGLPVNVSQVHKRYLLDFQGVFFPTLDESIKTQRFYIEDMFIQHGMKEENSDHKYYVKLRRRGQGSHFLYTLSQKEFKNDQKISTHKKQLSYKDYMFMISLRDTTRQALIKERICFMSEGTFFVIDTYLNVKEGFTLLKVKLKDEHIPKTPHFVNIKRDVSNEKGYTSRVLAKKDWYVPEGDEDIILNLRKDSA